MAYAQVLDNVIEAHRLPDMRARLNRLDAQRKCMRVPDRLWRVMMKRARKSDRPLAEALQSELNVYAHMILHAL
jgi:hypothetical protein